MQITKQILGKICFVFYIAGFVFQIFFCYEVFAKQKKTKLARHYYSFPTPLQVKT